jgi:predicted TIM-barrel fold metal-dependent hydrolase
MREDQPVTHEAEAEGPPEALIDTHRHLVLRDSLGYAWTDPLPPLAGAFTPDDYDRLTEGAGIAGVLHMETGVDEADWRAEARLVAALPDPRLLGQVAVCRPETEAGFEDWLDECESLRVVGFRRILHVVPDGLSEAPAFRANLDRIAARGRSFDLCLRADQLGIGLALARACPGLRFVLDHGGNPPVATGAWEPWAAGIDALGACENVFVKLSGLTVHCPPGETTAALLRPWVDRLLEAFGPGRMLWGSDWPVTDLNSGLPGWLAATRELLAPLSADEQAQVASGTARRVYRLG